ncbi:unnamed protein product [Cuscuta europaea]|nr:unnamed protein product [Cuscuta europaea]
MTSIQKKKFILWFRDRVTTLSKENNSSVSKHLLALAHGPNRAVTSVNGYIINGSMFRTVKSERGRETQNNGVVAKGESGVENLEYYGVLQEIIEAQYIGANHVTLFKCDW